MYPKYVLKKCKNFKIRKHKFCAMSDLLLNHTIARLHLLETLSRIRILLKELQKMEDEARGQFFLCGCRANLYSFLLWNLGLKLPQP